MTSPLDDQPLQEGPLGGRAGGVDEHGGALWPRDALQPAIRDHADPIGPVQDDGRVAEDQMVDPVVTVTEKRDRGRGAPGMHWVAPAPVEAGNCSRQPFPRSESNTVPLWIRTTGGPSVSASSTRVPSASFIQ